MDVFLEQLLARRSVQQYIGEEISNDALQLVLQAGLASASGRNQKPWEWVVVRNRETLVKMSHCRKNGAAKMLQNADCAIVVLGNREKTDTLVEDCSIVMSNMHLMADHLGLGSCWIQGRMRYAEDDTTTEEYLRQLLQFPEIFQLEAILSLGIPLQKPEPHQVESFDTSKVHWEKF